MLYPNLCYSLVCYKGTALYIVKYNNLPNYGVRDKYFNAAFVKFYQITDKNNNQNITVMYPRFLLA